MTNEVKFDCHDLNLVVFARNIRELQKIAKLIVSKVRNDTFLLLNGDLGAGKTSLTKLVSRELGINENVTSPTFNILKRYWIPARKCFLNHFDFFRLRPNEDISFFDDIKIGNINVIEWPFVNEYFWKFEKEIVKVSIYIEKDGTRKLVIMFNGVRNLNKNEKIKNKAR